MKLLKWIFSEAFIMPWLSMLMIIVVLSFIFDAYILIQIGKIVLYGGLGICIIGDILK